MAAALASGDALSKKGSLNTDDSGLACVGLSRPSDFHASDAAPCTSTLSSPSRSSLDAPTGLGSVAFHESPPSWVSYSLSGYESSSPCPPSTICTSPTKGASSGALWKETPPSLDLSSVPRSVTASSPPGLASMRATGSGADSTLRKGPSGSSVSKITPPSPTKSQPFVPFEAAIRS